MIFPDALEIRVVFQQIRLLFGLRQDGADEFDVPQFEVHLPAVAARTDEEDEPADVGIGLRLDHLGLPLHLRHGDAGREDPRVGRGLERGAPLLEAQEVPLLRVLRPEVERVGRLAFTAPRVERNAPAAQFERLDGDLDGDVSHGLAPARGGDVQHAV
ncbi:MAG: hypothetical protein IKR43_07505, partial [Lachnospiraceae bacterium]|nr:hypothetical protein [Lachnospiraceae bacterium]